MTGQSGHGSGIVTETLGNDSNRNADGAGGLKESVVHGGKADEGDDGKVDFRPAAWANCSKFLAGPVTVEASINADTRIGDMEEGISEYSP